MHVWRHVFRLDGRQVRGDDLRIAKHVAHLDGPVAHARGHVEDGPRRLRGRKGREEQPVAQEPLDGFALERQPLLLGGVVGECVCCASPGQPMGGGSMRFMEGRRGRRVRRGSGRSGPEEAGEGVSQPAR